MFENRECIASIHNSESLTIALANPRLKHLFLLYGDIMNIGDIMQQINNANKKAFLHVDFIKGLSTDSRGLQYVAEIIQPYGIVSTRGQVIQHAKKHQLKTIQRLFLIDSNAVQTGLKSVKMSSPDAVEAMPGLMPRVISDLSNEIDLPIVAGGLFKTKEELTSALDAGAVAVSAGNPALW